LISLLPSWDMVTNIERNTSAESSDEGEIIHF
jgi:hypothetical protein